MEFHTHLVDYNSINILVILLYLLNSLILFIVLSLIYYYVDFFKVVLLSSLKLSILLFIYFSDKSF